ncbi:hypothetical protein CJA_0591 [Cellvibrio japonicus Ueda107]|uniref:Uncharacterized protein n=1 Tax=Cellvibrio japonicus (strain Ueda107) TaxID=498211 RepID=B3PJI5_CELJU|nr:hypothetical protein CJA_0591 [Cellvibrio japonicus Ueda107]
MKQIHYLITQVYPTPDVLKPKDSVSQPFNTATNIADCNNTALHLKKYSLSQ